MTTPVYPLHPDTKAFIRDWYVRDVLRAVDRDVALEDAKDKAKAGAIALRDHLQSQRVLEMQENAILREMRRGLVPEEFRDGPVFHPSMREAA